MPKKKKGRDSKEGHSLNGSRFARKFRQKGKAARTPSIRSAGQIDRDRILYSSAWRRLASVTQVVHSGEGSSFHTRMTHSLKVAQIGRRLAEYLVNWDHTKRPVEKYGGLCPDTVESSCLCHDMGHPPFGHIAESELHDCLKNVNAPGGFEGNAQSFRIVTKLSLHRPKYEGLNLTAATLAGILKYPWVRAATHEERSKKWGVYDSEEDYFRFAREECSLETEGTDKITAPRALEAAIMDWADDVTYSVHDAEDFYRIGIVPLHHLLTLKAAKDAERRNFIEWAESKGVLKGSGADRIGSVDWAETFFVNLGMNAAASDLGRFAHTTHQCQTLKHMSSILIGRYLGGEKGDPTFQVVPALPPGEETKEKVGQRLFEN